MKPLIVNVSTAWECSGLSLDAFGDLVDGLIASGRAVRHRDLIVFAHTRAAAIVLSGRPRRRRR